MLCKEFNSSFSKRYSRKCQIREHPSCKKNYWHLDDIPNGNYLVKVGIANLYNPPSIVNIQVNGVSVYDHFNLDHT